MLLPEHYHPLQPIRLDVKSLKGRYDPIYPVLSLRRLYIFRIPSSVCTRRRLDDVLVLRRRPDITKVEGNPGGGERDCRPSPHTH